MNYPSIFECLCEELSDFGENPERYLGPNYESVINLWSFVDTLSQEHHNSLGDAYIKTGFSQRSERYSKIDEFCYNEDYEDSDIIWETVLSVCNLKIKDGDNDNEIWFPHCIAWITLEMMVMHELLNQGIAPMFIPLFDSM